MKKYNVCSYNRVIDPKHSPVYTFTTIIEAKNIREVFHKMKLQFGRDVDIYWIEEEVTFWKRVTRFNKYFYVDRKNGKLKGPKIVYDATKKDYITKYPPFEEMLSKGRYIAALKSLRFTRVRKKFIKQFSSKFVQYRIKIERFLISNNLDVGTIMNDKRIDDQTRLLREKMSFDLTSHISKSDPTGKTSGCNCKYCKLLYYEKKYFNLQEQAFDKLMLSRAYHHDYIKLGKRGVFNRPEGKYFISILPVVPSSEKRLYKEFLALHEKYKYFSDLRRKLKIALQLPNTLQYGKNNKK